MAFVPGWETKNLERVTASFSLSRFRSVGTRFRQKFLRPSAQKYRKALRKTIQDGESSWPALAPFTVARKGHDRPLIDTEQLLDSFDVFQIDEDTFEVGVREGLGRRDDVLTMSEVAIRNEFGFTDPETNRRIPPRPFNQPTFDRMFDELCKDARDRWIEILRSV